MDSFRQSLWHPGEKGKIEDAGDEMHCEFHLDSGGSLILRFLQGNVGDLLGLYEIMRPYNSG
jgi:hypothetical protein